jgi:hypothetical protein
LAGESILPLLREKNFGGKCGQMNFESYLELRSWEKDWVWKKRGHNGRGRAQLWEDPGGEHESPVKALPNSSGPGSSAAHGMSEPPPLAQRLKTTMDF